MGRYMGRYYYVWSRVDMIWIWDMFAFIIFVR